MLPVTHHSGARPADLSSHPVVWNGRRVSFGFGQIQNLLFGRSYPLSQSIHTHRCPRWRRTGWARHGLRLRLLSPRLSRPHASQQQRQALSTPRAEFTMSDVTHRIDFQKSTRLMLSLVAASAGTRSDRRRGDQGDVKPRKWLVGDHGGKNPPSADPSYLPGRAGRVSCKCDYRMKLNTCQVFICTIFQRAALRRSGFPA